MISVLLPVRNGEEYLDIAIASILDQTYEDIELIVIDDGSTDRSREIAEAASREDPRVRVLSGPPRGVSASLNEGLAAAERPWVARMDADDVSLPQRFERQLDAAGTDPSVIAWTTWAYAIDRSGRHSSLMPRGPVSRSEFARQHADGRLDVNCATVIMRRDAVLEAGGYDTRLRVGEDTELYDRLGEIGPLLTVPEPLYEIRIRADSVFATGVAEGLRVGRFVAARRAARLRGDDLSYERFLSAEATAPRSRRMLRELHVRARVMHERGTVRYVDGRPLGAVAAFVAAAALDPACAVRGIRRRLRVRGQNEP